MEKKYRSIKDASIILKKAIKNKTGNMRTSELTEMEINFMLSSIMKIKKAPVKFNLPSGAIIEILNFK